MRVALILLIIFSAVWLLSSQAQNEGLVSETIATSSRVHTAVSTSPSFADRQNLGMREHNFTWHPVVKVVDGDTLVVHVGGENVTVRLIGLNTPETVDPRKKVQCFGREASEQAKHILSGSSVRLEMDPSQGTYDKYGRTLAYIFLKDGTNFNQLMIAEGYGHEYTYNLPYTYQSEFKAAEKKARAQKKGLWADDACAEESTRSVTGNNDLVDRHSATSGAYECSKNVYNCSDFKAQSKAQSVFESCGGGDNDIHKLDSDGDGKVCESLP